MATFIGTTATTATKAALTTASFITSFSLANTTGGSITASVGSKYGSTITYILYTIPFAAAGSANSGYVYTGNPILLPIGYDIYISVSGQTDYIFTLTD